MRWPNDGTLARWHCPSCAPTADCLGKPFGQPQAPYYVRWRYEHRGIEEAYCGEGAYVGHPDKINDPRCLTCAGPVRFSRVRCTDHVWTFHRGADAMSGLERVIEYCTQCSWCTRKTQIPLAVEKAWYASLLDSQPRVLPPEP